MKLYYKFILSYIIFGVAAFAVIATLSTLLTHRYLIQSQSQTLYDEANLIASSYSGDYDEDAVNLETIEPQIRAIGTYLHSQIWVMDKNGNIIADSKGDTVQPYEKNELNRVAICIAE